MSRLFCYGSEGGLEKLDSLMKAVRFIIVEAALLVPDRPFFRKINRFVESSMERVVVVVAVEPQPVADSSIL